MGNFTAAERRGLILLAVILAAILAVLAFRSLTGSAPSHTVAIPSATIAPDSIANGQPVIRKPRKSRSADTAASHRRHHSASPSGKSRDYLDDLIPTSD